jgi:hypothetical protein
MIKLLNPVMNRMTAGLKKPILVIILLFFSSNFESGSAQSRSVSGRSASSSNFKLSFHNLKSQKISITVDFYPDLKKMIRGKRDSE